MHKIKLLVVGNLKEKYWKDACDEYIKRLSRFAQVEIKECPEFLNNSKTSVDYIKKQECENLLKNMTGFIVSMDKNGNQLTSEEFSKLIDNAYMSGNKNITFVIGGSNGLTEEVIKKSDEVVSFGKVTFPHQLMRVVLLEQIYRAETILNNISYHK